MNTAKKKTPTEKKVSAAMREVFHDKPSTVDTDKSPEGQRKQMVAIALSKARAAGAKIPKKGGNTTLSTNSLKYKALQGRKDNLENKHKFAEGTCDARES